MVKLKKNKTLHCHVMYLFKILTISFVFKNRVKHAVSESTEVFQGEGLGKTPDG